MKAWKCSLESQVCEIDEVSVLWVDFGMFWLCFLSSTPRSSTIIHVFQVGQISRDRLYRVRLVGNWYESLAYPGDPREQPIWRGITVTLWKLWKQTQATSHDVSTSIFWERETWDAVIPTESLDSQFHPTSQVHWWGSGAHDSNSSVFRSHSWRYTCETWRWLWQVPTKAKVHRLYRFFQVSSDEKPL